MLRKNQQMYMGGCISPEQMKIISDSRIFWRKLAIWTREYLNSRYLNKGNEEDIRNRLLNISKEFSDMLRMLFSGEAAEKYDQLLTQHIFFIRDLITAQLDGNREAMNRNVSSLKQNGEIRAAFLASLYPPLWNETEWKNMIRTYLGLTIEEANLIASGDYSGNIEAFDNLTLQTNIIGDNFAHGLYHYLTDTTPGFNQPLTTEKCISFDLMTILYYIRIYWLEMAAWTRAYIVGRTINLDGANKAYERLRQVPIQYNNFLKTFFDEEMVTQNLQLIDTHFDLIKNLMAAIMNNNQEEVNQTVELIYRNADGIAAILTQMNPYLDQNQWRTILYHYMSSTMNEITAFLTGDYDRDIDLYQRLMEQSEEISRTFSESLLDYISVHQPGLFRQSIS